MTYKIELNTAEYIGLLDRLNKLNEERPEKFLKDDLIPKIQKAKVYDENPEKEPALL